MTIIPLAVGPGYDVVVAPLEQSADRLRALLGGRAVPVVTDERVWSLHGAALKALVGAAEPLLVPEGEEAKQWPTLQRLIADFSRLGVDRSTPVIALGGGSIGDLTGLAAGLFKRGCPVIHVPTTLLAQADSAVGGKTAIDAEGQKNLVGMFHQPALVLADPTLLRTLHPRQLHAGYAEVVKYGLIDDPAFFGWCEDHGAALIGGDEDARNRAIVTCIRAKARTVSADVEDRGGTRALLNLGHTFAHAIEAVAGLGTVLHGEAVSIGMTLAFDFSARLELCSADDAVRVRRHLQACGLPVTLAQAGLSGQGEALLREMGADKKNTGGRLRLVLAHGIGRAFLSDGVERAALAEFLRDAP